jgi:hypothetical protein
MIPLIFIKKFMAKNFLLNQKFLLILPQEAQKVQEEELLEKIQIFQLQMMTLQEKNVDNVIIQEMDFNVLPHKFICLVILVEN